MKYCWKQGGAKAYFNTPPYHCISISSKTKYIVTRINRSVGVLTFKFPAHCSIRRQKKTITSKSAVCLERGEGGSVNIQQTRNDPLPLEKLQQNRWGSLSASLLIFWLGYSDFSPNKSQNCSDSVPSLCGLDCKFGCRKLASIWKPDK